MRLAINSFARILSQSRKRLKTDTLKWNQLQKKAETEQTLSQKTLQIVRNYTFN